MVKVKKMLVDESKYNIKCPYEMDGEYFVVHNTANDASAENEIKYMINNNKSTSFHYAGDDKEIIQGIPENRNAWHAGDGRNGKGNRKGIAIEICYSKSGGDKFIQAEKNAAEFIAMKLKEKGWGIDRVKKHQDFSKKYCPHRTLDLGWDRFLNMIKEYLGEEIKPAKPSKYINNSRVESWQIVMNKVYKCGLAVDRNFGPMCEREANKHQLYKKKLVALRIRNDYVTFVQKRLRELGYNISVDGSFWEETDKVVKQFQRDRGLDDDGYVGPKTIKELLR